MCINLLYHIFLIADSISLLWVIYFIKTGCNFFSFTNSFAGIIITDILLILPPIIITLVLLFLTRFLQSDSIDGDITYIESADSNFLPIYLGYFFVALSIPNFYVLIWVTILLSILIYISQISYYNPLFYLFKYRFYYVYSSNSIKTFIITKDVIRDSKDISFRNLKRINDFTFIDSDMYNQKNRERK